MSLFNNLEKFSSRVCVIDDNKNEYKYKDLLLQVKKLEKYINKRSIVFLICKNNYEFVISYVTLIRTKAVFFLINKAIIEKKMINLIDQYKPEFILSPDEKEIGIHNFKKIYQIKNKYNLFKKDKKNNFKPHKNLALLISTSGSTGTPKFVKLSYENIYDNTKKIVKFLKIKSIDRPITTMDPSYSYAISILNSHLHVGASIIMTEKSLFEKNFWELFKLKKSTTFGGVPFIYNILKKINFEKLKLPSLKYITQAGGNLNNLLIVEFIKICKKKKIKLFIMYGQTEASPRMSILDWKIINKKLGSIGKPLSGGNFFLYSPNKKIIKKNDTEGELVYTGKNVMLGYAENFNDIKKNNNVNSKLFTGDLAKRDKDGFYYITGRKSRFIKIFGTRFNLDEIEKEINSNGIDCACIGEDDNLNFFITDNSKIKFITEYVKKNFQINKINLSFFEIHKIPRSENGKVQYTQL
jgi:long-chain acyl-CoA synthetase